MQHFGYAGNILFVDLTDGVISKEPIDTYMAQTYIGGAGINIMLAYNFIPLDCDPLSPDSGIIIGTGPFNGTMIPGASETMIIYKSPLNGSFLFSSGGGRFSHMLKSTGHDHVVITGRSQRPVYLVIGDDITELCDATDLWGRDAYDATDELRKRHEPCSMFTIGQAGENLAAISVCQIDKGGTVGSGGLPAVMGSKNLKAIMATQGTAEVRIADKRKLHRLIDEILEQVANYPRRNEMMLGGSMSMTQGWVGPGIVTHGATMLEPYPPNIDEIQRQIYEVHKNSRKKIACATCPIGDKDRIDIVDKGMVVYDTAIMTDMALMAASPLGHSDSELSLDMYADALCYFDLSNRYGIDRVYSFRGLFDFVVTLYEEGIITTEDTGGIKPDRDLATMLKLLHMVTFREGIGDTLADGITKAVRKIDRGAEKFARNVVKGQFPFGDPRLSALGPMEFAGLVYPGRVMGFAGAIGAFAYNPGFPLDKITSRVIKCGVPEDALSRIFNKDTFNIGRMVKHGEDFFMLFNMLGLCYRIYISRFYDARKLAQLYSAVTGVEVTWHDLKLAGERIWNLWRVMNYHVGFDRKDDQPPAVWFEPLKGRSEEYHLTDYYKTRKLSKEDVNEMLDDYYDEHGWDIERGVPTREKLVSLGLADMVNVT